MKAFRASVFYLSLSLCPALFANPICVDSQDTFNDYDSQVPPEEINNLTSEYYVLSYTWAPNHCARIRPQDKAPGRREYLQCGSGAQFGYILHGLWPQGSIKDPGNYPRACEGNKPKIDRRILENYLCMTPSVYLLQHEYEYHGTCMTDVNLRAPASYLSKALALHQKIKLPNRRLAATELHWWSENNTQLNEKGIIYDEGSKEWRFCLGKDFAFMSCPSKNIDASQPETPRNGAENNETSDCPIKGNISSRGRKLYFTSSHRDYQDVIIDTNMGERCFSSTQNAEGAGWIKAP
jgi:ribonuclease T2